MAELAIGICDDVACTGSDTGVVLDEDMVLMMGAEIDDFMVCVVSAPEKGADSLPVDINEDDERLPGPLLRVNELGVPV